MRVQISVFPSTKGVGWAKTTKATGVLGKVACTKVCFDKIIFLQCTFTLVYKKYYPLLC